MLTQSAITTEHQCNTTLSRRQKLSTHFGLHVYTFPTSNPSWFYSWWRIYIFIESFSYLLLEKPTQSSPKTLPQKTPWADQRRREGVEKAVRETEGFQDHPDGAPIQLEPTPPLGWPIARYVTRRLQQRCMGQLQLLSVDRSMSRDNCKQRLQVLWFRQL